MRNYARHLYRFVLTGSALLALSFAPSGAWAQQNNNNTGQGQVAQGQDADQGVLFTFDQFLDAHADIATQLRTNPSLATNRDFLSDHPQLQDFLNDHPQIQRQITANPDSFMDRVSRFERSHVDQRADNNVNRNPDTDRNANPDLTRGEVASMDQFLDSHQSIEQQLQANPSLINNQTFLQNHPALQAFLSAHPNIQAEFAENPQYFILRTNRYEGTPADQRADNNAVNRNPNPDLTRGEVASMDQFLDSHQSIEQQLQANPRLITDQDFLRNHPQLQSYLNQHPQVAAEFAENPQYFMLRTNRYEGTPADQRADNNVNRNPDTDRNANPDLTRGEVASMDQFLDSHQDIEKQLQRNPSLINNVSYLKKHAQLRAFLSDHPQVREEFTENPSLFMQREGQYENTEYRNGEARYYNGDRNMNQQDVATMDAYLDKHASEARDLQAYPARVNDSDYLAHHKDLESFFKKHPQVREEFTTNPSAFMGAESTFEADSEMDEFLDNHKKLAKDLDENPDRVKDNDYLNHHKDLKSFLEKNPGVNDQFEDNPRAFMDREKRFDTDRDFDVYLTKHRDVDKDLQKDPDRVKDEKYLNKHKDLKELMEKHPDLDERAKMNPSGLMQERAKFHEDYKNHQIQEKSKVEQRANVHPH
jgi:nucleoside phosphorylase